MNTAGFVEISWWPTIITAIVCLGLAVLMSWITIKKGISTGLTVTVLYASVIAALLASAGAYAFSTNEASPDAQQRFEQTLATQYGATSDVDFQALMDQTNWGNPTFATFTIDGHEKRIMVTRVDERFEFTQGTELLAKAG